MNRIIALVYAERIDSVTGGQTQHHQQSFTGGMAALIQQVLIKAHLGIKRAIERAHQYQHADALMTLDLTALNQLVNGAAQGVVVCLEVRDGLVLGGQITTIATVLT